MDGRIWSKGSNGPRPKGASVSPVLVIARLEIEVVMLKRFLGAAVQVAADLLVQPLLGLRVVQVGRAVPPGGSNLP